MVSGMRGPSSRRHLAWWTVVIFVALAALPASARSVLEDIGKTVEKAAQDTGKTVEKAAQDTGKTLEKAVHDTGDTLDKAGRDTGDALRKAESDTRNEAQRVGRTLNRWGDEVCKAICDLGCAGSDDCDCSCSGGVAADSEGNVSAYDPTTGQRYSGSPSNEPSTTDLVQFERFRAQLDPRGHWYVEHYGYSNRFLLHYDSLSKPIPTGTVRFYPPTVLEELRLPTEEDRAGGMYWSPRSSSKHADGRLHASFDFLNDPGDPVFAPVSGQVVGLSNPGNSGLTGLAIEQDLGDGRTLRAVIFYVAPSEAIKTSLDLGGRVPVTGGETVVGVAQDITTKETYGPQMRQHVHVELYDHNGNYLDLDESLSKVVTDLVIKRNTGRD